MEEYQLQYKDRKGTNCAKWDNLEPMFGEEDLLSMWVADMDFEVPTCVLHSLEEYLKQGVFGYYNTPKEYYQAFINWEKKYHGYTVDREWIRYAPGVVPAIHWLVQIFTKPQDAVMVQTPVYYPFFRAIKNNGRTLVENPLVNQNGVYTMDFQDMEEKIQKYQVKAFVLCSPHNPVGRVWTKEELQTLLSICYKYQVKVIADEIHQDIIVGDRKQVSAATIGDYDDILVTVTAATKTFNLASCQNSFVIIPNKNLRDSFDNFIKTIHVGAGNAFGYIAVQSAYENGRGWLEAALKQIRENYAYMKEALSVHLKDAVLSPLEGTYLTWLDLRAYPDMQDADKVKEMIQKQCGMAVDYGQWFGGADYIGFIRINLATSKENVQTAIMRLVKALEK